MSTHALTCYLTKEYDGRTLAEVGHFWRKFDGQPTTHGYDLKQLVGRKRFQTLWDLMATVARLSVKVDGTNYNWMFVPVEPHIMDVDAQYRYYLSLADKDGEMPTGGGCEAEWNVHLKVKRGEETIYAGLLRYIPDDDAEEIEEEMDAEAAAAARASKVKRKCRPPGLLSADKRALIICRIIAYLSRNERVPCLVKGRQEIHGQELVNLALCAMPDPELLELDKGMKSCFGNRYVSPQPQ